MPKSVDRDERREELLEAVWRVVARDGIERTTIRTIARETGWSSGVLAHYFEDKDDILLSSLRLAHERIAARWEQKLEGLGGLEALRVLVVDNLPLDDERLRETRLLMNYRSRQLRQRDAEPARWRRGPALVHRLRDLVDEARRGGELPDGPPSADDVAERLLAFIDGLSLHAVLDPGRLDPERQLALVEQELAQLTTPSSRTTTTDAPPQPRVAP